VVGAVQTHDRSENIDRRLVTRGRGRGLRARRLARGLHQTLWGIHTPRPAPQQHVPRPSWKKGVGCFFYLFSPPTSPLCFVSRHVDRLVNRHRSVSVPLSRVQAQLRRAVVRVWAGRGRGGRRHVSMSARVCGLAPAPSPPHPFVGPPSPPLALIHIAPGAWVGADARPDAGAAGAKLSHMSEGRFLGRAARLPRARLHAQRGRR
jgi:hypothetical protein